jgi:hypothetical protein
VGAVRFSVPMGTPNILPDSRPRERRGAIRTPQGTFVPVYCANCGKPYGMVPESHITHVFALCDHGCAGKYGDAAHAYVDPDAVYRDLACAEAIEKYGRPLTPAEVARELESGTPIAAIARDWHVHALKES